MIRRREGICGTLLREHVTEDPDRCFGDVIALIGNGPYNSCHGGRGGPANPEGRHEYAGQHHARAKTIFLQFLATGTHFTFFCNVIDLQIR